MTSWLRRRPFVYYAADVWTDGLIALGAPKPVVAVMRRVEGLRDAARGRRDRRLRRGRREGAIVRRGRTTGSASIGNGVDTEIFRPDGPVADTVSPTFVYTGAMSEWQGPTVFVEAMPRILAGIPDREHPVLRPGRRGARDPGDRRTTRPHQRARARRDPPGRDGAVDPGRDGRTGEHPPRASATTSRSRRRPTLLPPAVRLSSSPGSVSARSWSRRTISGGAPRSSPQRSQTPCSRPCAPSESGQSALSSAARVAWVRSNASIAATGHRAAEVVLDALRSRSRAR